MAGNAHRSRPRSKPCSADCIYCKSRPKFGEYKNKTGNRHNPARGKRARKKKLQIKIV